MSPNPPKIAPLWCAFSPFLTQKYLKTNPPFQEAGYGPGRPIASIHI